MIGGFDLSRCKDEAVTGSNVDGKGSADGPNIHGIGFDGFDDLSAAELEVILFDLPEIAYGVNNGRQVIDRSSSYLNCFRPEA